MGMGRMVEGSRCPRCGSTLLSDGTLIWCSFVGSQGGRLTEPPCVYGIDAPVVVPPVPVPAEATGNRPCAKCPLCRDSGFNVTQEPCTCSAGRAMRGVVDPVLGTRTITVFDRCTTPTCKRVLDAISEGQRGLCSSCWITQMLPEKRAAINRLLAVAFNGASAAEKKAAIEDAAKQLKDAK